MFSRKTEYKSTKKIAPIAASAFLALVVVGGLSLVPAANAAVSFNPETGTGFVGKGDVQTALGWNNAQLQSGTVSFTAELTTVTDSTWTCDRDAGPQTQERARTTETTTQQVAGSEARVKNQITGFNLMGYTGNPTVISSTTEGPPLNSCPTGWTAINQQSQTTVTGGALKVNSVTIATF